jgi:hypothetical protein
MDRREMMNRPAPEVLATMSGALQILEGYAPEVLVVEAVSEC